MIRVGNELWIYFIGLDVAHSLDQDRRLKDVLDREKPHKGSHGAVGEVRSATGNGVEIRISQLATFARACKRRLPPSGDGGYEPGVDNDLQYQEDGNRCRRQRKRATYSVVVTDPAAGQRPGGQADGEGGFMRAGPASRLRGAAGGRAVEEPGKVIVAGQ